MNDQLQRADSNDEASLTDKTCFYTPYNQSILSKSNISVEKIKVPPKENPKHKITNETLKAIAKTENLGQITELNLDGNSRNMKHRLKGISGLHNLMNLRELNMSNNDIEKIENLNSLKNLHVLNLSFNKILKLENISVLKNLEILNLSNNLIEEIPPIIIKNTNLIELNLSNNLISEKSSITSLRNLTKLTSFDLSGNSITELQGYPTFVFSSLKKLLTLDGKPTPNYSRMSGANSIQQPSITLADIPARNPQAALDELGASEHQSQVNEPPSATTLARISYEKRLQVTQNRLAELSQLSNQIRLAEANDETRKNQMENEYKEESPYIDFQRFGEDGTPLSQDYGLTNKQSWAEKEHPQYNEEGDMEYLRSDSGLSGKGVIGRYLKENTSLNQGKGQGQANSLQLEQPNFSGVGKLSYAPNTTPINNQLGFRGNFSNENENSGGIFSESGSDMKSNVHRPKEVEIQKMTVSPQKKFIDLQSGGAMQEYYTGLSHKKLSNTKYREPRESPSDMNKDLWSCLAKMTTQEGTQLKSEGNPTISSFSVSHQNVKHVDERMDNKEEEIYESRIQLGKNQYQLMMNSLQPTFGNLEMGKNFESRNNSNAEAQKEKDAVQSNMVQLSGRIGALRLEINQRFTEYDGLSNVVNHKKERVVNILSNIDETIQFEVLSSRKMNLQDQENVILFKEKLELLKQIKGFLEIVEYQNEKHLNYFLLWNQVNQKLEDKELKEITINGQKFTVESVDSMFSSLSKDIDMNCNRLNALSSQIFSLKEYIQNTAMNAMKNQGYNTSSPYSNVLDTNWRDLFGGFDTLAQDTVSRGKLFIELRSLYINLFKLIKAMIYFRRNEAILDLTAKPLGKATFEDFLQTSPKNSGYDLNSASQSKVFSSISSDSYTKNKENWHDLKVDTTSSHSRLINNVVLQDNDISRRALGELNKDNKTQNKTKNIRSSEKKAGGKGDTMKLVRSAKKPGTSPQVKQKTRKSMYDATTMMKENQQGGKMRNMRDDDLMLEMMSENADPSSPGMYESPKGFSSVKKMQNKKDIRSAESLKGILSKVTTPRGITGRLDSVENEKTCQYCIAKDNIVRLTQEEMLKVHKEKADSEIEVNQLKAELEIVKQESQAQIAQLQEELLHTTQTQHQEKDQYTKAIVLLSELCNNNSAKLDEIRLRIISTVEKSGNSSANPIGWLLGMHLSTIEDLIKANGDLQEKVNIFINEFEQLLSNGIVSYLNSPHKQIEPTPVHAPMKGFEDISNINKTPRDQTPFYSREATPVNNPSGLQSIQEVDSFLPPSANKGYLGQFHADKPEEQTPDRLEGFVLEPQVTGSGSKLGSPETGIKNINETSIELTGGPMLPTQRKLIASDATNTAPESFTLDPQHHENQLPLNIENVDNKHIYNECSSVEQLTLHKSLSEGPEGYNTFHQILFGNGSNRHSRGISKTLNQQNSASGIGESVINENYTSMNKESGLNISCSPRKVQMARIQASFMSNLQENIAQHFRQSEKSDAYKHLKKISNNIQNYKGIKERISDQLERRSSKGSSTLTNSKSKTVGQSTPSRLGKTSSMSMMTYRGSGIGDKTYSIPDSTREMLSVRTPSNQGRPQMDYTKIFRKQVTYPMTQERDVNVPVKDLLDNKKRVLESPEVLNYCERFDMTSPYHPVYLGTGKEGHKGSASLLGGQMSRRGKETTRGKSIDKNLNH